MTPNEESTSRATDLVYRYHPAFAYFGIGFILFFGSLPFWGIGSVRDLLHNPLGYILLLGVFGGLVLGLNLIYLRYRILVVGTKGLTIVDLFRKKVILWNVISEIVPTHARGATGVNLVLEKPHRVVRLNTTFLIPKQGFMKNIRMRASNAKYRSALPFEY